jgi:hypothetical protein
VSVSYGFRIEGPVPGDLSLVVERPDLYTITCNGRPVAVGPERWLDRAFGRMSIAAAARAGENEIRLEASPFTIQHEIESAYLLGSFSLQPVPQGFVVAAERPLALGAWKDQGHPFYSEGVAYTERFTIQRAAGKYEVHLPRWYGSVAKVTVNRQAAGAIYAAPWSLDVSPWIRPGINVVELEVVGTLKNTLGPHHGEPPLGTAWPAMFQKATNPGPPPGSQYSTVAYGLFAPFTLVHVK